MAKKFWIGLVLVGLLANFASLQGADDSKAAADRLKEAWAIKKTSFKKDKAVKETILLKTVECYCSLIKDFPEAKAECAEACFRIGEIFRTLKRVEDSEREFMRVLDFDKSGAFAARALKEVGHLYRRAKEYDKALGFYKRVMDEFAGQKEQCADAYTWIGKVHLVKKEYDKARDFFLSFVEKFPEFPDDGIRNVDLAVGSYITEGNREAAVSLLSKWRQHFESLLGKDEKLDRKIEKALERMKSPEKLQE